MNSSLSFTERLERMRQGGRILVDTLRLLKTHTFIGQTGAELDRLAEEYIRDHGAEPAFKNYQPSFASSPFPSTLCLSLNDVIVHGFPTKDLVLQAGDLVKLDLGVKFQGCFTDAAITLTIGNVSDQIKHLITATREALLAGLTVAEPGKTFGDLGWKIESLLLDRGFSVIHNLCGHDIGEYIHGDLQVLNYGDPGTGPVIQPQSTFTIEPMASIDCQEGIQAGDYLFRTDNGAPAAHFEVTLAITEHGNTILTPIFEIV